MNQRRINSHDNRLADHVVLVKDRAVASYRRLRHDIFEQCDIFLYESDDWCLMMGRALDGLGPVPQVDVILDEPVSMGAVSGPKTFSGWSISEMSDVIEVVINDLFSKQARIIQIDRSVVTKAADVITQCGSAMARLFFARPSCDFRYSVFCQLGPSKRGFDVCRDTQVSFAVGLPQFKVVSSTFAASTVVRHKTKLRAKIDVGAAERIEAQLPPVSSPFPFLSVSKAVALHAEGTLEHADVINSVHSLGTDKIPLVISDVSETISSVSCAPVVKGDSRTTDATVCILLDDRVDTAIAAAAYLNRQSNGTPVFEVGLWRRRFKSAFHRFCLVNDIFELSRLPLSDGDIQGLSDFFGRLANSSEIVAPTMVFGEEILADRSSSLIIELLNAAFDRCHFVFFGPEDRVQEVCSRELLPFFDAALPCITVVVNQFHAVPHGLDDRFVATLRCSIPIHIKQQIMVAEKKGVAHQTIHELSQYILDR